MAQYQQPYQQPYYPPPPPPPVGGTSAWAIISLIGGILGWLGVFGIGGLVAVICGHIAKGEIRKSGGTVTGGGLATTGLILGYLNLAGVLVAVCLFILSTLGLFALPVCAVPFLNNN
jgi:hypothetical protein